MVLIGPQVCKWVKFYIFRLTNWPHMTFGLHLWPLTSWTCEGYYTIINKPSLVPTGLQLFKQGKFYISSPSYNLISDDFWPDIWPLTAWTYKGSHIVSINKVWFQLDFNFSNEGTFTFSAYLTTWPKMTFDLDMRPLTSSTNESSHVASMTQLWLKSIKACGG